MSHPTLKYLRWFKGAAVGIRDSGYTMADKNSVAMWLELNRLTLYSEIDMAEDYGGQYLPKTSPLSDFNEVEWKRK